MIRLRLICMGVAFLPHRVALTVIDLAADRLLRPAHPVRSTDNWERS